MPPAFSWIIEHRLAGSGRPGLLSPIEEDLAFLREQGIRTIITLTEAPLTELADDDHFEHVHFPVPDMGFPTPRACAELCTQILRRMEVAPVLLHCHAGLGRTGTVAACCLVSMGELPEHAVLRLRTLNRYYVQTASQEQFIHHYAEHLARGDPPVLPSPR